MIESMDENEKDQDIRKKSGGTPVLDNFSRDLNKLAAEGKLDPVVGRESEITRIAQILSRRKKKIMQLLSVNRVLVKLQL